MPEAPEPTKRRLGRPLLLSLLGSVLVAPVPILASAPKLIPAEFLATVAGVPVLSWLLIALMAALVGVAVLCASTISLSDD